MWLLTVHGRFGKVGGDVDVDRFRNFASVDARIDANAVEMSTKSYAEWVKSDEFFDVAHYPEIRFRFRIVSAAALAPWRRVERHVDDPRHRSAGDVRSRTLGVRSPGRTTARSSSRDRSIAPHSACARGAARSATRSICISRCSLFRRRASESVTRAGGAARLTRWMRIALPAVLARACGRVRAQSANLARQADAVVAAARPSSSLVHAR